jgi:hypothetical protein
MLRAFHRPKLVALKRGGEIVCSSTNHPANRKKLERNSSVEQHRPFNSDLDPRACADFVERSHVLGGHEEAASAQIDGTPSPRKQKWSGTKPEAEVNAEVQLITRI